MRTTLILLVVVCTTSCGRGVFLQDDGFAERIPDECTSRWECTTLLEEARRREATCETNTIGKVRCDEARADLAAVERMKRRFDEREAERAAREEEKKREQARLAKEERERAEEQSLREEEALRALEERRAAEAAESARLDYYRPMTLELRVKRLERCRQDGTESRQDLGLTRSCDELLVDLLAVTEASEQKQRLAQANEEAIDAVRKEEERQESMERARRESQHRRNYDSSSSSQVGSSSSGSGRLLCCDGTLSPTCMCSGSRRGCCSHHGGVCGCD